MTGFLRKIFDLASVPADLVEGLADALVGRTPPSAEGSRIVTPLDNARGFYTALQENDSAIALEYLAARDKEKDESRKFPLAQGMLALAAKQGMAPVVRELLKTHGADPNDRLPTSADSHMTGLHAAVLNNNIPMALELMALGADPGATISPNNLAYVKPEWGNLQTSNLPLSALDIALVLDNHGMIDALVAHGAGLETPSASGYTPMAVAKARECHTSVDILKGYGVEDGAAGVGKDPSRIFAAAIQGNIAEMERLIAAGADINQRDRKGFTPLMLAARNCQKDMIACLVKNKADVHAVVEGHGFPPQTAMDLACEAWGKSAPENMGALKILADTGARRPFGNNFGWKSEVPEFLDKIYAEKTPTAPRNNLRL